MLVPPDHAGHHRALAVFAAVLATSAWAGAAGLIVGFLGLGPEVESRLPFASPVFGGLALIAVVAVPMSILAVLAWRGDPRTGDAAVACGVLQVGWIVVELLFIRELSFFHPLYVVIGLVLIFVGRRIRRSVGSGSWS